MIPTIGLMIGTYAGFRMIEVFLFAQGRYASAGVRTAAMILAAIAFVVITVCSISLIFSSASVPTP